MADIQFEKRRLKGVREVFVGSLIDIRHNHACLFIFKALAIDAPVPKAAPVIRAGFF